MLGSGGRGRGTGLGSSSGRMETSISGISSMERETGPGFSIATLELRMKGPGKTARRRERASSV